MSETLWVGLLTAAAAIAGSFATYWQNKKTVQRQLEHADRAWQRDVCQKAYGDFLCATDVLLMHIQDKRVENFTADGQRNRGERETLFREFNAAAQRAAIVSPADVEKLIGAVVMSIIACYEAGDSDQTVSAAYRSRGAFYDAARRQLGAAGDSVAFVPPAD